MPSKTLPRATPPMPMQVPSLFQAYADACMQAMAETYVYTTKLTNITLQAAQRSMNEGAAAVNNTAEASIDLTPEAPPVPSMSTLPDLMATATTLQNIMMRNAAEWQQQFVNNMHQYGRAAGARPFNRTSP